MEDNTNVLGVREQAPWPNTEAERAAPRARNVDSKIIRRPQWGVNSAGLVAGIHSLADGALAEEEGTA